jgi:SAM-dependent methyltransferase
MTDDTGDKTAETEQQSSRFLQIVNEVEAELRRRDPYFTSERPNYLNGLARIAGLHRGGTLLEIGGYPFYFSMCLRKLGLDLTTVDLAPRRALDLICEHSLRVVTCDIERNPLPFENHSVATIALCATFEHLRVNPVFALEEMRRVLQPGGVLYLTTPNLYRLGNIVSFAFGRGLAFDPINEYGKLRSVGHMGHVREYTASEERRFLERAGFAKVEIEMKATPSSRRSRKLIAAVQRVLPGIRGQLIVTARPALTPRD